MRNELERAVTRGSSICACFCRLGRLLQHHRVGLQDAAKPSFLKRAWTGPSGVDWRVLTVWDSPGGEQRVATTWEQLGRLCVHRDRGGQGELKSCTPPGGTGGPQAAAMRLNDRPADGQPHTSPVILGRKECPGDLVRLLRGQSHTGIADRDQQLTIAGFRLNGELTCTSHSLHGI